MAFSTDLWGAPLSGDVSQWMRTWIQSTGAGQFGLINIFVQKTLKPDVEATVVTEVASYGRQLGKIADVLDVLSGQLDQTKLRPEQKEAIDDFKAMLEEIRRVKRRDLGTREVPLS
jgi:hypothetical protein